MIPGHVRVRYADVLQKLHLRRLAAPAVVAFAFSMMPVVRGSVVGATWSQSVDLNLGAMGGKLSLSASSFGTPFSIDTSKLRFTARPYGKPNAQTEPLRVVFGAPQFVPPPRTMLLADRVEVGFTIPVRVFDAPKKAGVYGIQVTASDGFARTRNGVELPLADQGLSAPSPQTYMWWPDEAHGDRALTQLRHRLVGKRIYGYGGIATNCPPSWTHFYGPSTPLRVRSVERERVFEWLGTGNLASAPLMDGLGFIAAGPLRIVVDEPPIQPSGMNYGVGGIPGPCPELTLADWQIDVVIDTRLPPGPPQLQRAPLRVGMSRSALIWSRGYPNELGDRAALRMQSIWPYGFTSVDAYTVAFRNNRVVSFTLPHGLP